MAMEKQYVMKETHTRGITAIGCHPVRREILLGCEDGVIKTYEAESGKLMHTSHEHTGWITDFLFDVKLMLSAANDGMIVAWSSGNTIFDRIYIGQPVYCMAINPRRHQMVLGLNGAIQVYAIDENKESGHLLHKKPAYTAREHTDIVRCIVCHESRIYSAGYDQRLLIYNSSFNGDDDDMEPINDVNSTAHDAGISCLILAKDNENNTWVVTGSFDKTIKIWTTDGKMVHKREGFLSTVTGICFVPRNKTIWAAGGSSYAHLYDPKSGDNVSDFIGTFQTQEEEKYTLQCLKFFPELNQVVASTSRRHLIVWKYNSSGCITALKCKAAIESLTYTKKVPLLIFSGDSQGVIIKWERMQSNHFMYSKESYFPSDTKKKKKQPQSDNSELDQNQLNQMKSKSIHSHYAFNKPIVPPVSTHAHPNTTILCTVFVEELDYILAASEDSKIYVWGFDEAAVDVLKNMKPIDNDALIRKYAILLDQDSPLLPSKTNMKITSEEDSVTNRVAGFICKYILSEHMSCVTCMVVIGRDQGFDSTYVVSGGWDRRLCIWNLETGKTRSGILLKTIRLKALELACDGIIIAMAYCPKRNEIAYASSDRMVYIRKFSPNGSEMTLTNTLQGHEMDITCIRWNNVTGKWVTGSEDGSIRIWSGEGMNECEQILSAQGQVSAMCIDKENGAIVAGVQDIIRVYDPEHYRLVQSNVGHKDAVRSILHIPERSQYVSASWDKTIRIWNSWRMPRVKKKATDKTKQKTARFEIPGTPGTPKTPKTPSTPKKPGTPKTPGTTKTPTTTVESENMDTDDDNTIAEDQS